MSIFNSMPILSMPLIWELERSHVMGSYGLPYYGSSVVIWGALWNRLAVKLSIINITYKEVLGFAINEHKSDQSTSVKSE